MCVCVCVQLLSFLWWGAVIFSMYLMLGFFYNVRFKNMGLIFFNHLMLGFFCNARFKNMGLIPKP